jgi:hypothetical protein
LSDPYAAGSSVNTDSKTSAHGSSNLSTSFYITTLTKLQEEKKTYTEKLENARGDDIFKYLLLIDASALESYVVQTRIQAKESFQNSKYIAIAGFALIAIGISLGIASNFVGVSTLDAAYLASLAGILTEFISGTFFYLYNRTLQQLNLFHQRMLASKQIATSLLANSLIEDKGKRDDSKAELSKLLMSNSTNREQPEG